VHCYSNKLLSVLAVCCSHYLFELHAILKHNFI